MDEIALTRLHNIREYALAVLDGRVVLHDGPDNCLDSHSYSLRSYFRMIAYETVLPGEGPVDFGNDVAEGGE